MTESAGPIHKLRPHPFLEACRGNLRHGAAPLLVEWLEDGRLDSEGLAKVIGTVWSTAESPEAQLSAAQWVALFRRSGFISLSCSGPPTQPLTLYRGASWTRRSGMAWSQSISVARRFAAEYSAPPGADTYIFRVTVPAEAVLADLTHPMAGEPGIHDEAEMVVDPELLPLISRTCVVETFPASEAPS